MMRNVRLGLIGVVLVAVTGCCPKGPPGATGNALHPYTGPPEPVTEVVARINQNNEKIPSLWSSLFYKANIIDDHKHGHYVSGEGNLLYRAPMDLRLVGRVEPAGVVFDIGSNRNQFWLRIIPELDTMWWGTYAHLAEMDPDHLDIPIRPDLVLSVLGISTIATNPAVMPAATMRYVAEQDAYVFIWNARLPDRWAAVREVWYDRSTLRPRLVLLYDLNGRVVLRAELKTYKQVQAANRPQVEWPWIAGDYKLSFPATGSTMEFTLSDDTVLRHGALPINASFTMPNPNNAGVGRVIEVGAAQQQNRAQ